MRRCNIICKYTRRVKVNAWPLLLWGCTAVRNQWWEFVCVSRVCLSWKQGMALFLGLGALVSGTDDVPWVIVCGLLPVSLN
jgi:hypothetical protein